jgi:hypothetical protein
VTTDVAQVEILEKVQELLQTGLIAQGPERETLLEIAGDAVRNRTTLGEIKRCPKLFVEDTKHKLNLLVGFYSKEIKRDDKSLKRQNK